MTVIFCSYQTFNFFIFYLFFFFIYLFIYFFVVLSNKEDKPQAPFPLSFLYWLAGETKEPIHFS